MPNVVEFVSTFLFSLPAEYRELAAMNSFQYLKF
jgi:hypothetical protein